MINEYQLYFGLPIQLGEKVYLNQPTLREILNSKLSLEEIVEPFISLDTRNFPKEKDNKNLKNFDMFYTQILIGYINYMTEKGEQIDINDWLQSEDSNGLVVKRLIKVLKFLFKTDDIEFVIPNGIKSEVEEIYITVNKSYKINRETYETVKEMVFEILDTHIEFKQKTEEELERERELDEYNRKLEAKRKAWEEKHGKKLKKSKEKNSEKLNIFTLANYIIHSQFSQYNYNTIQDLTIYQIKNTFKYYQSQETYQMDMSYRTSGNFEMKNKAEHWFFDKE